MKRVIRVIISVALTVSLLFGALSLLGCDRKYDEAEVVEAAEQLLRNAEILNEVYYGRGISYVTGGHSDGYYYEADGLHLHNLGFSTISELKELTDATFTADYANELYSTYLSPITDGEYILGMTRYYQLYEDQINKIDPICIMVYSEFDPIKTDDISYDYSTLRVSGVEKKTVYVTVSATVENADKDTQVRQIEFGMIEESHGWRIDGPTFVNYRKS